MRISPFLTLVACFHALLPGQANLTVLYPGTGMRYPAVKAGMRGNQLQIQSATIVDLIADAYGVQANRVLGGPNWLEMDRFDVIARHRGRFSRIGAAPAQVEKLRVDHGVYMVGDSRINVAGLPEDRLDMLAASIITVMGEG